MHACACKCVLSVRVQTCTASSSTRRMNKSGTHLGQEKYKYDNKNIKITNKINKKLLADQAKKEVTGAVFLRTWNTQSYLLYSRIFTSSASLGSDIQVSANSTQNTADNHDSFANPEIPRCRHATVRDRQQKSPTNSRISRNCFV